MFSTSMTYREQESRKKTVQVRRNCGVRFIDDGTSNNLSVVLDLLRRHVSSPFFLAFFPSPLCERKEPTSESSRVSSHGQKNRLQSWLAILRA